MNYFDYSLIGIGLFIIILFPRLFRNKFSSKELASFSTILGILGTFIGVTKGLLDFNVNDIQGSIPQLLQGLTLAFITSIGGMTISLILKIKPSIYGIHRKPNDSKGASIETLALLLKDINDNQIISNNALIKSLTGDGDSTIITQIQKLRTTSTDKLDELNKSFNTFADKMVANNTQALIDALTDVMHDFNTKINEQFGENFKELNHAVKLILVWQENYKEQIELSIAQLQQTSNCMTSTEIAINKLAANSTILIDASQRMEKALSDVLSGLNGFAELGNQAKSALPKINDNIELLTSNFTDRIKSSIDEIQKQSVNLTEAQDKIKEITLSRIDNVNASIEKQFKELDEALSSELTKALEALGNQLASVSNKFVQDYVPLTNKLKEVVNLAERLEAKN
ncbi:hypothetical protein DF185_07180 [Marinifilum breve]|uniref:MotA/TolQ/ExbB proton channel domain-containing protein n=1 Tax=Marinifilum breve TaxID=2184082 RepID=A0A2V4AEB5_9BACT|nr:hypothetical protein [Marinifilum breve]PXY02424.1 hypothetical protein DF185_07180 [Marinifilum breve]